MKTNTHWLAGDVSVQGNPFTRARILSVDEEKLIKCTFLCGLHCSLVTFSLLFYIFSPDFLLYVVSPLRRRCAALSNKNFTGSSETLFEFYPSQPCQAVKDGDASDGPFWLYFSCRASSRGEASHIKDSLLDAICVRSLSTRYD